MTLKITQAAREAAEYRGWEVHQGRWPEPAWVATHPDYDASWEGEEDGWVDNGMKADAPTLDALHEEIDAIMDEHPHFAIRALKGQS
ncbi:MAG: hypothetical protein KGL39_59930 [Patescibacteria group bacterium]|nr:hypothetical protein [Patescibacteria group bacterium]